MANGHEATRVIVVEDDADLCESLCAFFRLSGMDARAAGSVAELEQELAREPTDVIVLDINLPGETGFAAIHRLELKQRAGLIVLTGRSAPHDRLHGLTLGADHYLVKPIDMTELVLLIRNLHARLRGMAPAQGWVLDAAFWTLASPDGRKLVLGPQESRLMERLMANPGQPVRRVDLMAALQPEASDTTEREVHLEVLICRLRRKVQKALQCDLPLQSVRAFGYVFRNDGQVGTTLPEHDGAASKLLSDTLARFDAHQRARSV